MVETAKLAAEHLRAKGISVGIVNGRFIKPLDQAALLEASKKVKLIVTIEENALCGGYGEGIISYLNQENRLGDCRVLNLGIPDEFVSHGKREFLLRDIRLDEDSLVERILTAYQEIEREALKQ